MKNREERKLSSLVIIAFFVLFVATACVVSIRYLSNVNGPDFIENSLEAATELVETQNESEYTGTEEDFDVSAQPMPGTEINTPEENVNSQVLETYEGQGTQPETAFGAEEPGLTSLESSGTQEVDIPDFPLPDRVYSQKTYTMVSDIVYLCRVKGVESSRAELEPMLTALETEDAALGKLWRDITSSVARTEKDFVVNKDLVSVLPQDDSLCIVVLGYQLEHGGAMPAELLARCEKALVAAKEYPNAYIALTGGGTAMGKRDVTEAAVMERWFTEQGIASERLIIEDKSLTTDQNASNCCDIFARRYPQIKEVLIVTSDYHVPLGTVMFEQAALKFAYEYGCDLPYKVSSNLACEAAGDSSYSGTGNIMRYVWTMADPKY